MYVLSKFVNEDIEFEISKDIINSIPYKELKNASILENYNEKLKFQKKYDIESDYHNDFVRKHNIPEFNNICDFFRWVEENKANSSQ